MISTRDEVHSVPLRPYVEEGVAFAFPAFPDFRSEMEMVEIISIERPVFVWVGPVREVWRQIPAAFYEVCQPSYVRGVVFRPPGSPKSVPHDNLAGALGYRAVYPIHVGEQQVCGVQELECGTDLWCSTFRETVYNPGLNGRKVGGTGHQLVKKSRNHQSKPNR